MARPPKPKRQFSDVPCKMTTHNVVGEICPGHYMRSAKTGYPVLDARLVRGHRDKWRLSCLRCAPEDIPADAVIHDIKWFSRKKKA